MIKFGVVVNNDFKIGFEADGIEGRETDIELLVKNYLPGSKLAEISTCGLQISYVTSDEKHLEIGEKKIVIFDDWGEKISLDLWHLLYSIVRKHYLGRNLWPAHAACAGKDNYVLLVGHSGVGKTTLLLKLANDFGVKIYSGNKTVVGPDDDQALRAVAGTKAISLRVEELYKYENLKNKATAFSDRAALILDGASYGMTSEVKIAAICVVKINDNFDQKIELVHPANLHTLYPYFMDTVNADTVMCGGDDVYSGTIDRGISIQLARNLRQGLRGIKTLRLSGSKDYLSSEINKLL